MTSDFHDSETEEIKSVDTAQTSDGEEFDLANIAAAETEDESQSRIDALTNLERIQVTVEGLRDIVKWFVEPMNSEQIGRRVKVATLMLWPEMLKAQFGLGTRGTFEALAKAEGVKKQTIQALAGKFRDCFGWQPSTMRSATARQSMRESYERRHDDTTTASNT